MPETCDLGSPGGSAGKESTCNAADPGSIPGLGRSPGEGNSTHSSMLGLLWCSDSKESSVQKPWVLSLGWEDPLEEGMETHSSILGRRIPTVRGGAGGSPWGCKESIKTDQLSAHAQHVLSPTISSCSLALACPTLCDPVNYSMPGFLVLRDPPDFAQTHVHWVSDASN